MKLADFDYHLPEDLIAQSPAVPRSSSSLMVLNGEGIEHRKFYNFPDYLEEGDVLVVNDSRVLPARLSGRKKTGGKVDCLIVKREENFALCLLKGKNVRAGTKISFEGGLLSGTVREKIGDRFLIELHSDNLPKTLARIGRVPTPPYIKKEADMKEYQTVYAEKDGSIAAPTAGLHFTEGLMEKLQKKGVKIASITLHVGVGTFAPVKVCDVGTHEMEPEYFEIGKRDADLINNREGRLIAVGTTTVKTLESACNNGEVRPTSGWSDLFIYPGHAFKAPVDALLTNFHLPKSTLLMLVCAYAGKDEIFSAYNAAIKEGYRFYSFGDAMFIYHPPVNGPQRHPTI